MGSAQRIETIDLPLHQLFAVINDYAAYPEFVGGMKGAKLLGPGSGGSTRVEFDLDMMKRIRYVVQIRGDMNEARDSATVHWDLVSSDLMKKNSGTWTLKSAGPSRTEVTYELEVELNFPVPGFILKGLIAKQLPAAIAEFTKRTREKGG